MSEEDCRKLVDARRYIVIAAEMLEETGAPTLASIVLDGAARISERLEEEGYE